MFNSLQDAQKYIQVEDILFIDLKYSDLFGGWHHITLPARHLKEKLMDNGVGLDGSSVPGFKSLESGDMVIIPDLTTGFKEPFMEDKTLSFICNIHEADTKERFHRDPRFIAMRAEEYLKSSGIATESKWGPELEYYIFDHVSFQNDNHQSNYQIISQQATWNPQKNSVDMLSNRMTAHAGYHALPPADSLNEIRNETIRIMEECGIPVKYHHHEVGGSGQVEIEIEFGNPMRMGDAVMLGKYIIRMVALKHGRTATFMPKPIYGEAGSGMHFHQHLFKNGKPIFFDEKGYGGLSNIGLSYTAGLLKYGRTLVALTNPSVNSYKRLVPGYEAPVNLFFSLGNRSSAVRIPKYATLPDDKRVEFRPPDGTCNPYLAMASMLMAGIAGVQENLDIEKEGLGPFDMNLFDDKYKDIRDKIISLPENLGDALSFIKAEHDFLLKGDVFAEDIIDTWIQYKTREIKTYNYRPTPFEFQLYYNV